MLADPFTTPGDALLEGFAKRWPGAPVVGGMASGHHGSGQATFLTNEGLHDSGCIGVAVGGSVRLDPVVSQGCRPIGKHYVITKAQQNVILALGGKPALAQLRGVFGEVESRDQQLMQTALHVGRVIDERKSAFERGDLLVRNVLGIDTKNEAIAINDFVRPGQTIAVHGARQRGGQRGPLAPARQRVQARPGAGRDAVLVQRARQASSSEAEPTTSTACTRASATSRRRASSPTARSGRWAGIRSGLRVHRRAHRVSFRERKPGA